MELLDDIEILLKPSQHFLENERVIEVDISPRINVQQFALQPSFSFDSGAFSSVKVDEATGTKMVISLKNTITLTNIQDDLSIRYYAKSRNGDSLTGRVVFSELNYQISAAPITFELDACCSLPDKINIDVRDYNGGRPISLTGVGSNIADAGTVVLEDITMSDFNDDYNDDFGTDLHKKIQYTLNKTTDFWKTLGAVDRFEYTISYKGKTASNYITIKIK